MASISKSYRGKIEDSIEVIKNAIHKSSSASTEDEIIEEVKGVKIWLGVFERYSMIGENRLSMSVNIIENNNDIILNAVASGGSQGIFFKINTWGEESFLQTIMEPLDKHIEESNERYKIK